MLWGEVSKQMCQNYVKRGFIFSKFTIFDVRMVDFEHIWEYIPKYE